MVEQEEQRTALGMTLHGRPPLLEFACRFDKQRAGPLDVPNDCPLPREDSVYPT